MSSSESDDFKLGKTIRRYLLNNRSYGDAGIRDDHLQLNNVNINVRF
jgi:DNA topoisomerase IB